MAPLTKLIFTVRLFVSTEEVTFTRLKVLLTTTRVLLHPDPDRQLVVEADKSDIGVNTVLSQRNSSDQNLHPCAFFSRRFSPAKGNYNVGNWKLLALVLALQEWRHWLEGSAEPFVVWTDHKNLEHLHVAKWMVGAVGSLSGMLQPRP